MKMYGLEKLGISNVIAAHYNLSPAQLVEKALANNEGTLSDTGALLYQLVNILVVHQMINFL